MRVTALTILPKIILINLKKISWLNIWMQMMLVKIVNDFTIGILANAVDNIASVRIPTIIIMQLLMEMVVL